MAHFNRGDHTLNVFMTVFKDNRQRLCQAIQSANPPAKSLVFLQGAEERAFHNVDADYCTFRQESYFHWTTGVEESGFYCAISPDTCKTILFMPRIPLEYEAIMGKLKPPSWYKTKYEVDEVHYVDEMIDELKKLNPDVLLLLYGLNTDADLYTIPAKFDQIDSFKTDKTFLHPVISECRVFKSDAEIEALRFASMVSVEAHKKAMQMAKPGMYEYQLESVFRHHAFYNYGCRYLCYAAICGCGPNSAALHYGHAGAPNNRKIEDGDLCLLDMGAEYYCYGSDVTNTFPINGKFTEKQSIIYNAVYDASRSVLKVLKPGVSWVDMHILAERRILDHLIKGGLLTGDLDEMVKARLGATFMPHGLGHFLGHDVHDVGGYNKGNERIDQPGLNRLRTTREIKARMFLTVEPGCYFSDYCLDQALASPVLSKFMIKDEIEKYRGFGGVRIEDDILITENGCENFNAALPRTVREIESFMAHQS